MEFEGDIDKLPRFKFHPLNRSINWDRLRSLNIDRVKAREDTAAVLACSSDVAFGDVSQEEVDPLLLKALHTAQYSTQYLFSCQEVLKRRQKTIASALTVFDDEEEMLDLEIAKMRSRKRGLLRENRCLEEVRQDYVNLLTSLDPKLLKVYEKTVKLEKEKKSSRHRDSHRDKSHLQVLSLNNPLGRTGQDENIDIEFREANRENRTKRQQKQERREERRFSSDHYSEESNDYENRYDKQQTNSHRDEAVDSEDEKSITHSHHGSTSSRPPSARSTRSSRSNPVEAVTGLDSVPSLARVASRSELRLQEETEERDKGLRTSLSTASKEVVVTFLENSGTKANSLTRTSQDRNYNASNIDVKSSPWEVRRSANLEVEEFVDELETERSIDHDNSSAMNNSLTVPGTSASLQGKSQVVSLGMTLGSTMMSVDSLEVTGRNNQLGVPSKETMNANDSQSHSRQHQHQHPHQVQTGMSKPESATVTQPAKPVVRRRYGYNFDEDDHDNDDDNGNDNSGKGEEGKFSVPLNTGLASTAPAVIVSATSSPVVNAISASNARERDPKSPFNVTAPAPVTPQGDEVAEFSFISNNENKSTVKTYNRKLHSPTEQLEPLTSSSSSNSSQSYQEDYADDESGDKFEDDISPSRWKSQPRIATNAAKRRLKMTRSDQHQEHEDVFERSGGLNSFENSLDIQDLELSGGLNRSGNVGIGGGGFEIDTSMSVIIETDDLPNVSVTPPRSSRHGQSKKGFKDEDSKSGYGGDNRQASSSQNTSEKKETSRSIIGSRSSKEVKSSLASAASYLQKDSRNSANFAESKDQHSDSDEDNSPAVKFGNTQRITPRNLQSMQPKVPRSFRTDEDDVLFGTQQLKLDKPNSPKRTSSNEFGRRQDGDDDVLMGTFRVNNNNQNTNRGNNNMGRISEDFNQTTSSYPSSEGNVSARYHDDWEDDDPMERSGSGAKLRQLHDQVEQVPDREDVFVANRGRIESEDAVMMKPKQSSSNFGKFSEEDFVGSAATTKNIRRSNNNNSIIVDTPISTPISTPIAISMKKTLSEDEDGPMEWQRGRAALDLIETAKALDVFITSFQFDSDSDIPPQIQVQVDLLGVLSQLSPVISNDMMRFSLPINFSIHLRPNKEFSERLKRSLRHDAGSLYLTIIIIDKETAEIVGTSNVNLWIMYEDSCNILLQESDITSTDDTLLGTVKFDVRWYRFLQIT